MTPQPPPIDEVSPPPALPRLAITVGDVAGVGPELTLRCVADEDVLGVCHPVVVGPRQVLLRVAERLGLDCPPPGDFGSVAGSEPGVPGKATLVDVGDLRAAEVTPGRFTAETGLASFRAVESAARAALSGAVDAIVTGPIQKEAWHAAGIRFPGHTELLAHETGVAEPRMMLASDRLACVLVTIHVPLADVPGLLRTETILQTIRIAAGAGRSRRDVRPRVSVCGLNPHAGEGGLFSHGEEERLIAPAIAAARAEGIDARGPMPPDTAFTPAQRAATDVYVCMYHDQGLIPLKALSFDDAVNITLGLPIVRTSVDHGTALDLAWQGRASNRSMLAAIRAAAERVVPDSS